MPQPTGQKDPAAAVHEVQEAPTVEYWPALQGVHELAPAEEADPAGQLSHKPEDVALKNLLAAQLTGAVRETPCTL